LLSTAHTPTEHARTDVPRLARAEEHPRAPRRARARGAADAVRERARVRRRLELQHRVDAREVEPARGDVRREQHVRLPLLSRAGERGERARARGGGEVPVQAVQDGRGGQEQGEGVEEVVDGGAGAEVDDRAGGAGARLVCEDARELEELGGRGDEDVVVL
jgi:hypothetical protein